jgi:hypothetical protein
MQPLNKSSLCESESLASLCFRANKWARSKDRQSGVSTYNNAEGRLQVAPFVPAYPYHRDAQKAKAFVASPKFSQSPASAIPNATVFASGAKQSPHFGHSEGCARRGDCFVAQNAPRKDGYRRCDRLCERSEAISPFRALGWACQAGGLLGAQNAPRKDDHRSSHWELYVPHHSA